MVYSLTAGLGRFDELVKEEAFMIPRVPEQNPDLELRTTQLRHLL